jgi:hypothetical protein
MKTLLLILAVYALAGWHDAQAGCQRLKPDGSVEACQHMVPGAAPVTPNPKQAGANKCQIGGMVGYKAYLEATYDAQRPDGRRIKYMVDYWSDMTTLAHEKWAAYGAADYIAGKLQATGVRQPNPGAAYEAAMEFIVRECNK